MAAGRASLSLLPACVGTNEGEKEEHKADRESMLISVRLIGHALRYAVPEQMADHESKEQKADRVSMVETVKLNGYSGMYVTPEFKADRGFTCEAVKQNGDARKHAAHVIDGYPSTRGTRPLPSLPAPPECLASTSGDNAEENWGRMASIKLLAKPKA